ncbi:protein bfr2-like [Spodoptera litura]|uniref:Protein bfr2-like n=1 Tax=Spodoptera litura TaxID=69820 RepID=A0A9J7ENM2_SPOLT|nr:protein bfr2-like [Spodoptera litura]
MASRFIQDLSIDTGTIANIIDYPRNGLKVSLSATDYETERVRKEAQEPKKSEFKEDNEDVPHGDEKDTGDIGDISGDGDGDGKVENSDDAEETAAAKSSDDPMEGDTIKKSEGPEEVTASVTKKADELEGVQLQGEEIKGGDVTGANDEADEGVEVEEAEVGDEPNEGDDPMGDDDEVSDESEDDQSEGSDESDYDDDTDDDEALEGVAANASEQVDGIELANIGLKGREESDEEESDTDQDSDFEEEQPKASKGFIRVMTLSQSFGVIIQGSGATLSPQTKRKARSGKYIMIQLKNEPDIPKHSNVVIELQPDVCELFGKDAYDSMEKGDWTKMIQVAKKNGYPYPEVLNKMRASLGKAPIKIKPRN